jgi:hypothetical protein
MAEKEVRVGDLRMCLLDLQENLETKFDMALMEEELHFGKWHCLLIILIQLRVSSVCWADSE